MSIIPTTTGAARAVSLVLPELKGKLDGMAMRVPTPNVSVVDLVVVTRKKTSIEAVNAAMKEASKKGLKGILQYVDEPLVSKDFNGSSYSSSFDAALTSVIDGNMVKVISWYDNEWGYSCRVRDLIQFISKKR
jgi:glyceraldehyde 3-phosphate dehydrogenase